MCSISDYPVFVTDLTDMYANSIKNTPCAFQPEVNFLVLQHFLKWSLPSYFKQVFLLAEQLGSLPKCPVSLYWWQALFKLLFPDFSRNFPTFFPSFAYEQTRFTDLVTGVTDILDICASISSSCAATSRTCLSLKFPPSSNSLHLIVSDRHL